jgi:cytidylate kinase
MLARFTSLSGAGGVLQDLFIKSYLINRIASVRFGLDSSTLLATIMNPRGDKMKVLGSYEKARIYIEKTSSENLKTKKRRLNPGPLITISRETGIGAVAICEKLIEYLNLYAIEDYRDWTYFDRDLIEKVMTDHHLPEHFRKLLAEERTPKIDEWFGEILGITPSKLSLLHKTSHTILKLAETGNIICVGRGAQFITAKLPNSFHIRLVAPLNFRIENSIHLYNLDRKTAVDFIKKEDEERKDFILKYFHKNVEDPHLYHMVINTNLLKIEEIAEMIGHSVIRKFSRFFITSFSEMVNE